MADERRTHTHILHQRAAGIALGVGVALLTILAARSAQAQTFTTLFSFNGKDGAAPQAALVQATDGNLYGMTLQGGFQGSDGVVFKITTNGAETTLYRFCRLPLCPDGYYPREGLVQATNGDFYGTTEGGGANFGCEGQPTGCGTVFKITPNGALTTLYSFGSEGGWADGADPVATLVQAPDGNFYGTTASGGAYNNGTVFKITPSGTLTTLYSFCSQSACADGEWPEGGLVQATDGNFYGTTGAGGANESCDYGYGCGTVFKITPGGTLTTLYSFCAQSNCADGDGPYSPLVQATDGNFYGITTAGGANESCDYGSGCGTVFKITPGGTLTTLYSFCAQSNCADGDEPYSPLVQATDGNFYGLTSSGGNPGCSLGLGCGTVFKITPDGTLTTLYSFCPQGSNSCRNGAAPGEGGLVQHTNGNLYGTTNRGGDNDSGAVFSLAVGLGPFVETQPTLGSVGNLVKILGTNLTGSTSVTFNGTPAVFKVASPSLIMATVPAGATTGTVQVVTPSGTLNSNVPFRVRQH